MKNSLLRLANDRIRQINGSRSTQNQLYKRMDNIKMNLTNGKNIIINC